MVPARMVIETNMTMTSIMTGSCILKRSSGQYSFVFTYFFSFRIITHKSIDKHNRVCSLLIYLQIQIKARTTEQRARNVVLTLLLNLSHNCKLMTYTQRIARLLDPLFHTLSHSLTPLP